MTDLEMTRLCAEAMGIEVGRMLQADLWVSYDEDAPAGFSFYAPLRDDAQAMALVKRFGLTVRADVDICGIEDGGDWIVYCCDPRRWQNADKGVYLPQTARIGSFDLNRAIVECVAKMQRSSGGQGTPPDNAEAKSTTHPRSALPEEPK
jgi:hypothetical protein